MSALFNPRDQWHERAAIFFTANSREAVVPLSILGEVADMVEEKLGSRGPRSLANWLPPGFVQLEPLLPQDLRRMTLLMAKYPDLGFVDSSVVAIAERLMIGTIATTDQRHFTAVRPSHVERFTLVP